MGRARVAHRGKQRASNLPISRTPATALASLENALIRKEFEAFFENAMGMGYRYRGEVLLRYPENAKKK